MSLCELVEVWRRLPDGRLLCYRCFHLLPDNLFCVQSADYYGPGDAVDRQREHGKQFLELLAEDASERRGKPAASLEEAIEAFDQDFENTWK